MDEAKGVVATLETQRIFRSPITDAGQLLKKTEVPFLEKVGARPTCRVSFSPRFRFPVQGTNSPVRRGREGRTNRRAENVIKVFPKDRTAWRRIGRVGKSCASFPTLQPLQGTRRWPGTHRCRLRERARVLEGSRCSARLRGRSSCQFDGLLASFSPSTFWCSGLCPLVSR